MEIIYWITALAALLGVWLNVQKHVACFWIWAVTNAVWTYADITHDLLPQAGLQAVYFGLSIYGIWKWGMESKKGGTADGQAIT